MKYPDLYLAAVGLVGGSVAASSEMGATKLQIEVYDVLKKWDKFNLVHLRHRTNA